MMLVYQNRAQRCDIHKPLTALGGRVGIDLILITALGRPFWLKAALLKAAALRQGFAFPSHPPCAEHIFNFLQIIAWHRVDFCPLACSTRCCPFCQLTKLGFRGVGGWLFCYDACVPKQSAAV